MVNKVKSEYNAGPNNFIKAGQMFKCMDMAAWLSNNLGGVGVSSIFLNSIEEDVEKKSNHSGMNSFNPLSKMILNNNRAMSNFNFKH